MSRDPGTGRILPVMNVLKEGASLWHAPRAGSILNHSLDFCKFDGNLLACLDVLRKYHIPKAARVYVANPSVFWVAFQWIFARFFCRHFVGFSLVSYSRPRTANGLRSTTGFYLADNKVTKTDYLKILE